MSVIKKRGNAGDFLETALPDNIVSKFVLSSVQVEDGSYVDENLKKSEKKGELKHARRVLLVVAHDKLDILPQQLVEDINKIESAEILDELIRKSLRCESLEQFKGWIYKAMGR